MKGTRHNGRSGKNGVYNPLHNDRRFNPEHSEHIDNERVRQALNALPERKRDIILLSYFLDMSDAEIAELLNVVRTTVFRHRKSALAKIKQYLEGKADDEYR